jgi:F420-dependent oxidoreductase-like protein
VANLKLGIHFGQQDIELEELRRLWRHLDQSGIDRITVWDHHYESPPRDGNGVSYEALTLLAALAADTQRTQIGCFVFCPSYRHPALIAKSLTTIDHLSNGRVIAAIGAGWHVPEHEGYGFEFLEAKTRLDRLSEGVRIFRQMFTEPRTSFEGKHYHLKDAANIPRPVQQRLPIAVGGGGEKRTMAIAARYADEWNGGYMSSDAYRHKTKVLDEWCEKVGRDPASIDRSILVHFYMSSSGTVPERQRDGSIHGEPQQVIDQIGRYAGAGAGLVAFVIRPPIDWDAVQSLIEDVMPAFR